MIPVFHTSTRLVILWVPIFDLSKYPTFQYSLNTNIHKLLTSIPGKNIQSLLMCSGDISSSEHPTLHFTHAQSGAIAQGKLVTIVIGRVAKHGKQTRKAREGRNIFENCAASGPCLCSLACT